MTRYNLTFVLLFTLTLLVGCQEIPDIIVNVPPPTVTVVVEGDDDDSAGDDDDSAEPGDDDDSTDPEQLRIQVSVPPDVAPVGDTLVETSTQDVMMGVWRFTNRNFNTTIHLPYLAFRPVVQDDVNLFGDFSEGVDGDLSARDMLGNCYLGSPYMPGAIAADRAMAGDLEIYRFQEKPVLLPTPENGTNGISLDVALFCDVADYDPTALDAIAFLLWFPQAETMDGDTVIIENFGGDGTVENPTQRFYIEDDGQPALTFGLHPQSPGGSGIPWSSMTTLRFTVSAGSESVDLDSLYLEILSTDNSASFWNRCTPFAPYGLSEPNGIQLFDTANPSTAVGTFTPLTSNGYCQPSSTELINQAELIGSGLTIPAWDTMTFDVVVNTWGASSVGDDVIQVTLSGVAAITASGGSVNIQNIPVQGNPIQF